MSTTLPSSDVPPRPADTINSALIRRVRPEFDEMSGLGVTVPQASRLWDDLDEICQRGRVFYEMFPGTAASDAWRVAFAATHPHHVRPNESSNAVDNLKVEGPTSDGAAREIAL